jgi:hypothetical protein
VFCFDEIPKHLGSIWEAPGKHLSIALVDFASQIVVDGDDAAKICYVGPAP